jgi:hypothetical protein
MARKVKIGISIERYLQGPERKRRLAAKGKIKNLFDPMRYERAIMKRYETRKGERYL